MTRKLFVVLAVLVAILLAQAAAFVASSHAVSRGVCIPRLAEAEPVERDAILDELARGLRSTWVRLDVFWGQAELEPGVYDEQYLQKVADTCAAAALRGLKVMVTVYQVPQWASEQRFWSRPPAGNAPGYRHFYVPREDSLDEFQAFMQTLATHCGASVSAFECWNEPNLWMFLCPQKVGSDARFGARRYVKILKAFRAGVKASGSTALVVGGSLGPYGTDDWTRTSPNRFARQLRALQAGKYMDALSHHPYLVGSSATYPPERPPRVPERSITLANLSVLLTLFPGKPVYLTEYGYNTSNCPGLGALGIGQTRQADYLKRAYRYAARYSRVKALIWYLLRDEDGAYPWTTGLKTVGGARKRAWYAFSRVTRLTLSASASSVLGGRTATLSGRLTWYPKGGEVIALASRPIAIQVRSGTTWVTIALPKTRADGSFRATVRVRRSTTYRASWSGVVASPMRTIRVR